jgi:hypothetical protein
MTRRASLIASAWMLDGFRRARGAKPIAASDSDNGGPSGGRVMIVNAENSTAVLVQLAEQQERTTAAEESWDGLV